MTQRILRGIEIAITLVILAFVATYSAPALNDKNEKARAYTRNIEFNFITWMSNAAALKMQSASVGAPYIFDHETQRKIVVEYLRGTQSILEKEYYLEQIYADPNIADKESASKEIRAELEKLQARQDQIAPFAESILQDEISAVLAELGLAAAGQPVPNVWYHATPLPMALIISPRDHIEETGNISLQTNLAIDRQVALESRIDKNLDVSSLVTQIGGVGVYPTMVERTTNLNWTLNTVAHEWLHNYLTMRPLGLLYGETPQLRTMNETTASIAGDEIGALVVERFYPELKPATFSPISLIALPVNAPPPDTAPFDFRQAMHETRVRADALLAEGKIEEAEAYMESRRLVFLQNGYLLRKLNQAYFAFHGAYADTPVGAAGEDPVGPAVRALRAQSKSLADFVNTISWMTSFEQLQKAVK
ncbi:MAG: hypothetical protein PHQ36_09440 [Anaerolineales bacterium]|nr:hypothetical protein [Anaerolineales bacterium]